MTDFTLATEQVRDAYVRAMRDAFIASASEHREEFDRWVKREQHTARQQGYAERLHDEALGIGADLDEWTSPAHLQLATIRAEYARHVDSGDMHEFVRAVGQVLDQRDDLLDPPVIVPRPEDDTNG